VSAMLQLLLSEFFYSLDGTDTLIETSAPALFVGHKPAEVDDPFALEVCHESPSRASASQQLHRQSKTNNMTTAHCASAARAT